MAQNISWYGMIAPEESQFRVVNVKPVTLYDVAEYAGVSYQTVSRVVNRASHVSAKTREKVEAAMAQLNYIPNRVAQQLAGKQSLLIGVATSSLALHAPSQIVAAIKSRADQLGASVVVSMVERSGVEACKAAVHNLLAQRVSGLIINYPLDDQDAIAVEAACANVPALFLDVSDQTPINSIIFSHEDGTRLGVEHLVALGHQQIALLAGPLSSVSARLRLAGWHKYLTRNQIQPIAEREGDWSAMSGFQQTMQMLNEGIVPTAMLVANDQMALGNARHYRVRVARWCGYLGSGIRRYRRQLVLYPAVNHHQTGFSPAGANQRGPLAETLSGPGGEEQSAVARLTGEKKNHPGAQYANHLSPHVGRFLNAAGTTSFPT